MAKNVIAILVFSAVAFAVGTYFGASTADGAPVLTDSSSGKSYEGGMAKDAATEASKSANIKSVAGSWVDSPEVFVKPGESIQEAVQAATPGTTIRIMPGVYSETVYIDKDKIRLLGVIEKGERAVLDGEKKLNDAILYSGNHIVVENLTIKNYKGNGIMGQAGNNFELRNNVIIDAGVYGIFPQLGKNGVIEHNVISGIEDAAIYVGMSDNIHVAYNDVFDSVAGIEIENSRHAIVEHNYAHNNTGGILAFISPGLPIKTTYDVIIRQNFIVGNNHPNFGAPGSTVGGIPAGTGIMIMAADDVVIEGNVISDNKAYGILSVDHNTASELTNVTIDPESDPNSDRLKIFDNVMLNNGYDTVDELRPLMLAQLKTGNPDIVVLGPTKDSCIINRHRYVTLGVDDFAECDFTNTATTETYLLDPVPARVIAPEERGKIAFLGVCSGCHTYTGRLIGPPVQIIQALYMDNPQGLAEYIANPTRKREDYPEMPPQNYLDEATRMAVAEYMLKLKG